MATFQPNATTNGDRSYVRASRLNLLQLRKRIKDVAGRLGQLELVLDGEWPLEDSRFSQSSWPTSPEYRGMAALYLAAMPSNGSKEFKAWYSTTIFRDSLGKRRGGQDKASRVEVQRTILIEQVRIRWDAEAAEVCQCLHSSDGDVPAVIQSAFESARKIVCGPDETRRLQHKTELIQTVHAFKTALHAFPTDGGILQLELFINKSFERLKQGLSGIVYECCSRP